MKLSFAISLPETDSVWAIKNKWQKKCQLLADLSYEGVELGIKDAGKINISFLEKILQRYHLALSAIATGRMFIDEKLSLSSLDRGLRMQAIKRIKKHIEIAKIFSAQVITGLVRGRKTESTDNTTLYYRNLTDSFRKICDYASESNVVVTIEPINRYETDFLHCTKEAIDFIKTLKYKNLKLMLDTFHMNIEEQNFIDPIKKAKRYLSYVHLADSNRMCPGMGHIDFKRIIKTLKKTGYEGYLSAEILPSPEFTTSAREYISNIRRLL